MALRRERMRLGDILIKQHIITEDQLKKALELQKGTGKKIGEVFVDSGMITEEMIVRALQMQLGLKVVRLSGVVIPKEDHVLRHMDAIVGEAANHAECGEIIGAAHSVPCFRSGRSRSCGLRRGLK